jgi:hypothetical protein
VGYGFSGASLLILDFGLEVIWGCELRGSGYEILDKINDSFDFERQHATRNWKAKKKLFKKSCKSCLKKQIGLHRFFF